MKIPPAELYTLFLFLGVMGIGTISSTPCDASDKRLSVSHPQGTRWLICFGKQKVCVNVVHPIPDTQ